METESRPGYYKDNMGFWQVDRRKTQDRRKRHAYGGPDRRTVYRRKTDQEILDKEARIAIEEAIEELDEHPL